MLQSQFPKILNVRILASIMTIVWLQSYSQSTLAQGFVFSNYENLKGYYNPAFNAADNLMELNALHRIQNYSNNTQLNITGVNLNRPLFNKLKTKRWGGIGLSFAKEQLSTTNSYDANTLTASFAYNQQLFTNQYLSFGTQLGFHQQSYGASDTYITGNQWVPNFGYDPSMPVGENFNTLTDSYFSAGLGFLWYMTDLKDYKKFYAGFSAFNLNGPETQLLQEAQEVPFLYTSQLGARVIESGKHSLMLEGVGSFNDVKQVLGAGTKWTYHFEDMDPFNPFTSGEVNVFARYFNEGRISLGTSVAQKNFSFAFSMDFFTQNSRQGIASEFGLSIIKKLNLTKHKKTVETAAGYQIGTERNFDTQENVVLKPEPVDSIEKSYQTARVEGDFSFELSVNFNYEFNETALNKEAKTYLDDIYYMLKSNPALKLLVTGHTDNVGSRRANKKVSTERAENVVSYLKQKGISSERMKATGAGDTEPLLPNTSDANKAKNRRVEFLIFAEKE